MIIRYLNPQNDIAFKRIFGQEKNEDILRALLNSTLEAQLHRPIKAIRFLPRAQEPEIAAQKTSIVDILCRDEDDCNYIVEMQVAHSESFKARAQLYASKAYLNQAKKGHPYSDLKKVIFLAFTNYSLFPHKKNPRSDHKILDIVTHEQDLDKFAFTFVDLAKFKEQCKKPLEQLTLEEKFYYFLSRAQEITPEEFNALTTNEPIIHKAFETLDRFFWSEEEFQRYEQKEKQDWDYQDAQYQRGIDEGKEKGRKEGREEGIKEGKREMAKQMLLEKEPLEKIKKYTGLTAQALEDMKKEMEETA